MPGPFSAALGVLLLPLHRWVWIDPARRARKLLRFAATEADGARDITRAAELTRDPILRRLFARHAGDEARHARLFRARGLQLLGELAPGTTGRFAVEANWLTPGERGLDDLRVDELTDAELLTFLHQSEAAAARRFAQYLRVLDHDPGTQAVFAEVLRDEEFHMSYTRTQLDRLSLRSPARAVWRGRAGRLWRAYLRLAMAIAAILGGIVLTLQYFLLLPAFALLARRAARRQPPGWIQRQRTAGSALESQA